MYAPTLFRYEVTSTSKTRQLSKEIQLALVASVFLGYGGVYLFQSAGIYV
jgi:hypothetical protein